MIWNDLKVPCRLCVIKAPTPESRDSCVRCQNTGYEHFEPQCSIFLDLDGVCAGFDEGFEARFGVHPKNVGDDTMWAQIHRSEDFWLELPVLPGAYDFAEYIAPLNTEILTACPETNYIEAALAKKHWVLTKLPCNLRVLPVRGGAAKPLFMRNVGDILIDDYGKNIRMWEDAGGVGIKHEGDFAETKRTLIKILQDKYLHRQ